MSTIDGILAPFGVVLFVTLVVLLSYFFARRRQDTNRLAIEASAPSDQDTTDGEDDDREHVLGEATILSYPMLQYSKAASKDIDADDGSSSSCSICLSDYRETDTVRVLPECRHFFHVNCVDPWLKLHSTCPICRKQLLGAPNGSG